jgi:hypothetical protein
MDWAESAVYADVSHAYNILKGEIPRNTIIEFWISCLRLELGWVQCLREPDAPTIEWNDRLRYDYLHAEALCILFNPS